MRERFKFFCKRTWLRGGRERLHHETCLSLSAVVPVSKMRLLHMKHRSQQYDDLLFTASITLIRKDRIMHQHCQKYFYVRGGRGDGHFQNSG